MSLVGEEPFGAAPVMVRAVKTSAAERALKGNRLDSCAAPFLRHRAYRADAAQRGHLSVHSRGAARLVGAAGRRYLAPLFAGAARVFVAGLWRGRDDLDAGYLCASQGDGVGAAAGPRPVPFRAAAAGLAADQPHRGHRTPAGSGVDARRRRIGTTRERAYRRGPAVRAGRS